MPTSGPDRRVPFGREEMQLSFAPLVKQTAPAVVNVYASQTARQSARPSTAIRSSSSSSAGRRSRVRRIRWAPACSSTRAASSSPISTSSATPTRSRSRTSDGREFASKVLLKDETLDLAVLKIDRRRSVSGRSPIGDSDALEVGDLVLAIGNPFGVGQTTTSGIVSALARSHIGVSDFGFFIQTDAAINPGNSGGALINMGGQLVGINTAIFSRSGGSIGIGFAIPSNMVRAVVADAAKAGSDFFERPYIGADFEPVTPQIAESLGMATADRRAGFVRRRRRAGGQGGAEARRCRAGAQWRAGRASRRAGLPAGDAGIGSTASFDGAEQGREQAVDGRRWMRAPEGANARAK